MKMRKHCETRVKTENIIWKYDEMIYGISKGGHSLSSACWHCDSNACSTGRGCSVDAWVGNCCVISLQITIRASQKGTCHTVEESTTDEAVKTTLTTQANVSHWLVRWIRITIIWIQQTTPQCRVVISSDINV